MVQRYAHLAVGHLAVYADRAGLVIANDNGTKPPGVVATDSLGTNWAQSKSATPGPITDGAQVQENKGYVMVPAEGLEPPTP